MYLFFRFLLTSIITAAIEKKFATFFQLVNIFGHFE